MRFTRRSFIAAATSGMVALAGCLGDDEATISLLASSFDPRVVWIGVGETVLFEHESGAHTVTLFHEDNDVIQRSPVTATAFDEEINSGSIDQPFDTEGIHGIFCRPHEQAGMACAVVVGDYDDEEPGLATPQEELPGAMQDTLASINREILEGEPANGGGGTGPY